MKLGVNLVNFGPGARPETFLRWARGAEEIGYHFVAISDHVAVTPDVAEQYPAPFYEPFTTLAWLAGETERVGLATTVTVLPYRHPLQIARVSANLDRLSGGRFILGVGLGWAKQEYEALGVPFEHRGAIANESLEAIRALWTNEVASYEGRFFRFRDVHTGPLPVTRPHPPIWVGGDSRAAMRRAARLGTAWHPIQVRLPWLREKGLPSLHEASAHEGKPVPALCPRIRLRITADRVEHEKRLAGEGSLGQVRDDLAALEELGSTHVLLDLFTGDFEAIQRTDDCVGMLETVAEKAFDLARETAR